MPLPQRSRSDWALAFANFAAVLLLYFAFPASTDAPTAQLTLNLLLSAGGVALVAYVVLKESRTMVSQGSVQLSGLRLVLLLELVTVAFAFAYYVVATNGPGQIVGIHTRIDALYFTVTTMGTVGFGDIHATGQGARVLVTVNIAFNVAFLGLVANLIRTQLHNAAKEPPREDR